MLQGEFEYENGTRFDFGGNISQTKVWCGRILFAVLSCFLAILLIDVFLGYTICDVEVRKIFCTIYGMHIYTFCISISIHICIHRNLNA